MNFWWVNHKQTFRHEFRGGYIWSPKLRRDGRRNIFYDFMQMVRPGDIVLSYAGALVRGAGIARTYCYPSPRPDEFGHVGDAWDVTGWRVDVSFRPPQREVRPRDLLAEIRPFIGIRHAPLNADGTGRQSVYLAAIPNVLGTLIADRLGFVVPPLKTATLPNETTYEAILLGIDEWEQRERRLIEKADIAETERLDLIRARVGQGRFKENVSRFETQCRVTKVTNPVHLIASHIKPWREATNEERLSAANGLLLTPSVDHLFDRGFISFDDSGEILISPVADQDSLLRMGVNPAKPPHAGSFNCDQKHFLEHHRNAVFLRGVAV